MISKDQTNPDNIWVTEAWDSKDDHDVSLQDPKIRELIGKAMPLLDGNPKAGQKLEIFGGHGV